MFAELRRIWVWRQQAGPERDESNDDEIGDCNRANDSHAKARPSLIITRSARRLAVTVAAVSIRVMQTSTGTSRPVAARQASCPRPGESLIASIGIDAPNASVTETPAKASSGKSAGGTTWKKNKRAGGRPRARAMTTWGAATAARSCSYACGKTRGNTTA